MTSRIRSVPSFWNSVPFVIAIGCLIVIASFGPRSILGLFLEPMTSANGWSRETFALALALQNLMWGAGQPVAGAVADRFGTAKVIAAGGIVYALGLVLMAYAEGPFALHLTGGVMVGLGMSAASFSLVLSAFGRIVTPQKRSIAFGIGTAAGSFGQFVFGLGGIQLINQFGWQNALVALGLIVLITPVLAVFLRGTAIGDTGPLSMPQQSITQALKEAFGHRSYNLLVVGFFVCGFHVAFITVHLPPFLSDMGIATRWGGWAIALIGLFNIVGSLASGVIGGRMSKPVLLTFIYLARGVAIALFLTFPVTPVTVILFSAAMGLLWLSTVPPTSALVATMFGPRYMATLFGFVFFSHQVGAFFGVWLGGRLYDATGSYDSVWYIAIALSGFAALVHWPIQEKPVQRLQSGTA
uniref:MFS transporter n=1 Tax=Pararhizobium sp. IMCC3301 TaxID=3067904 RepID=UPI002741D983|nr:MFS transporter [Pararhizobium sp. IMCC3301]